MISIQTFVLNPLGVQTLSFKLLVSVTLLLEIAFQYSFCVNFILDRIFVVATFHGCYSNVCGQEI